MRTVLGYDDNVQFVPDGGGIGADEEGVYFDLTVVEPALYLNHSSDSWYGRIGDWCGESQSWSDARDGSARRDATGEACGRMPQLRLEWEGGDESLEAFPGGGAEVEAVVGPVVDEVAPAESGGGEAEESGEEGDVGDIDDVEGEECAVLLQVGLVAGDDPEGPEDVEAPGGAENGEEGVFLPGEGGKVSDEGEKADCDEGPEGDEVGGEGDEDVGLVGDDVSAVDADAEAADLAETEDHEDGVGEFVAEDVEVEEDLLAELGEEPPGVEDKADGEVNEGVLFPEVLGEAGIGDALEEGDGGNGAEREDEEAAEDPEDSGAGAAGRWGGIADAGNSGALGCETSAAPSAVVPELLGSLVG